MLGSIILTSGGRGVETLRLLHRADHRGVCSRVYSHGRGLPRMLASRSRPVARLNSWQDDGKREARMSAARRDDFDADTSAGAYADLAARGPLTDEETRRAREMLRSWREVEGDGAEEQGLAGLMLEEAFAENRRDRSVSVIPYGFRRHETAQERTERIERSLGVLRSLYDDDVAEQAETWSVLEAALDRDDSPRG